MAMPQSAPKMLVGGKTRALEFLVTQVRSGDADLSMGEILHVTKQNQYLLHEYERCNDKVGCSRKTM